jgi:uncharacterized protein YndB with AHSA1/START domain
MSDSEIVSSRILQVPVELLYTAFADPNHLKLWWGPAGFSNSFEEFDLQPGGKWTFIMHGPEADYRNECEFLTVEKNKEVTWKRFTAPFFQMAVLFESISDSEAKITFKMSFASAEECQGMKAFIVDKNEENFDRLEQELKKMSL